MKAGLSVAADPVSVCPAPTEHRLSWSHTPHPPSVASSTLFDPEGIYLTACAPPQALDFEVHMVYMQNSDCSSCDQTAKLTQLPPQLAVLTQASFLFDRWRTFCSRLGTRMSYCLHCRSSFCQALQPIAQRRNQSWLSAQQRQTIQRHCIQTLWRADTGRQPGLATKQPARTKHSVCFAGQQSVCSSCKSSNAHRQHHQQGEDRAFGRAAGGSSSACFAQDSCRANTHS